MTPENLDHLFACDACYHDWNNTHQLVLALCLSSITSSNRDSKRVTEPDMSSVGFSSVAGRSASFSGTDCACHFAKCGTLLTTEN